MRQQIVILCVFIILHHTKAKMMSWMDGHLDCTLSETTTDPRCIEADYMTHIHQILANASSNYHMQVAIAINSLYTDLKKNLHPTKINHHFTGERNYSDESGVLLVHPLSYSIPENLIRYQVPPKSRYFSSVIPGNESSYIYDEYEYVRHIESSLFALTYRKGGYDCLRHYEILAYGSIPLFTDISNCLSTALVTHPKRLYQLILQMPWIQLDWRHINRDTMLCSPLIFDEKLFDSRLYMTMNQALLRYTRQVLSTKAMATYFLETIHNYSNISYSNTGRTPSILKNKVLFFSHNPSTSAYITDTILHGLKHLLGGRSVIDFPRNELLYKQHHNMNETNYLKSKSRMYGRGFTYGLSIDEDIVEGTGERNPKIVEMNIRNHTYDLIVIASVHRMGTIPFWDLICNEYDPHEVALVIGGDEPPPMSRFKDLYKCSRHIFSREGLSPR